MTILPSDARVSPISKAERIVMNIAGSLIGPSEEDCALSPTQPLGSGFNHQASLYYWSWFNNSVQFVSIGNNPSRLVTGKKSIGASAVNEHYIRNFTCAERSEADFNSLVASIVVPSVVGKTVEVADGGISALRTAVGRISQRKSPMFIPGGMRLNPRFSQSGSVISPFAEIFGEGPEVAAINFMVRSPLQSHHPTFTVFLNAMARNGWISRRSLPRQTLSVLDTEIHNGIGGVLHPAWNDFVVSRGLPQLAVTRNTQMTEIANALARPGQTGGTTPTQLFNLLEEFYATPKGAWQGDGIALDSVHKLRAALGF